MIAGERRDEVLERIEQVNLASKAMVDEVLDAVDQWEEARDLWLGPVVTREAEDLLTVLDHLLARVEAVRATARRPEADAPESRAWERLVAAS